MVVKLIIVVLFVIGSVSNSSGKDIAERIKDRYENEAEKCLHSRGKEKPAYECSGILIRGVRKDVKLTYPWSLKDLNKQKGAFSVAFLRKDQLFSEFPRGYESGFIIYPHSETPLGKNIYKVYCAFPMDANADRRKGHGCGINFIDKSKKGVHCRKQNINSLDKWKTQYEQIMKSRDTNFVTRQCAFDMTIESAADDFIISIEANKYLQSMSRRYAYRNNELRMRAWNEMNANKIPIEAFFLYYWL